MMVQVIASSLLSWFRLSRQKEELWGFTLQNICGDQSLVAPRHAIRLQMEFLSGILTMTAILVSVISANLQAGNSQQSSSIMGQNHSVGQVWTETGNLNDLYVLE